MGLELNLFMTLFANQSCVSHVWRALGAGNHTTNQSAVVPLTGRMSCRGSSVGIRWHRSLK